MPPAGRIGIDRPIMMPTGTPTLRDVVRFPLLKKKKPVDLDTLQF